MEVDNDLEGIFKAVATMLLKFSPGKTRGEGFTADQIAASLNSHVEAPQSAKIDGKKLLEVLKNRKITNVL